MSNKQNFKKRPQAYQNRPMGNNTSTGEKAKNLLNGAAEEVAAAE